MGSPVLPKAQVCPTLTVAAYVGLGPSRDQKEGLIYPDFYDNFMGFCKLKSIILRSTQYKAMVILVQGCIHAESTNKKYFFMEYSPYVNSMVYTIG